MNISLTVNSKSVRTAPRAVTNPTGLILSPFLNPKPFLAILNDDTVNNVEPIPVVGFALTSTVTFNPWPVSVVAPIPRRDIPVTSRDSYEGSGTNILGFVYDTPAPATVKANVPPAPTVAVIFAPFPPPPPCPTKTVIVSVVTDLISVATPTIGSPVEELGVTPDLGYGCKLEKLSLEHLNTIPPVSIPTWLPTDKPWPAIVSSKNPVWDV